MTPLPLLLALTLMAPAASAAETVPGGRFGPVALVRPAGEPARVVLFLSGDGGWELGVRDMAAALARDGALVLGISTPRWVRSTRGERCAYPAGDLEALAQSVQQRLRLPVYLRPILVGYSSGATLAYAALAQAPAGTFLGAVSLGFCSDLDLPAPFCPGSGLSRSRKAGGKGELLSPRPSAAPWVLLTGRVDRACPLPQAERFAAVAKGRLVPLDGVGHGFAVASRYLGELREAVKSLDATALSKAALAPSAGPAVADLPLVETLSTAPGAAAFALLVTGDGGWAGIDREIAAALAATGLHVVGLDSLKYFWVRRTPEELASDLGRIIEHYAAAYGRGRVALVGYSRGADVLPAAVALLAPGPRGRVEAVALLGPGREATFELHLTDFLSSGGGGRPILPDVERLGGTPVVCLFGREEADESLCPLLAGRPGRTVIPLPGAHHFGGDYGAVAREVVRAMGAAASAK
jgi:type IV secretory pathway VirJ component